MDSLSICSLAGNELGHNGMKAVCAGRSSLSNIKELKYVTLSAIHLYSVS